MKRICGGSLAAESHVLSDALGQMEWACCMVAEALYPGFSLERRAEFLPKVSSCAIIDCKSIYDHVRGRGEPSGTTDKKSAIDCVLARQSLSRLGAELRCESY